MEKNRPKLSPEAAKKRSSSLGISERICEEILLDRLDIASKILRLRVKSEMTYDAMNEDDKVQDLLGEVGVESDSIRRSVIALLCQRLVPGQKNAEIMNSNLRKRPHVDNRSESGKRHAKEASQIYPWTQAHDRKLIQLTNALRRTPQRTDWVRVAEEMNKQYELNLTPAQWYERHRSVMRAKRKK
jgi:hypothetical protein